MNFRVYFTDDTQGDPPVSQRARILRLILHLKSLEFRVGHEMKHFQKQHSYRELHVLTPDLCCLTAYSLSQGPTGWVRTPLEKESPLPEICLFNVFQGPGKLPHLKLCELNDFFRDISSSSLLSTYSAFTPFCFLCLIGRWGRRGELGGMENRAKIFLKFSWKTVFGH